MLEADITSEILIRQFNTLNAPSKEYNLSVDVSMGYDWTKMNRYTNQNSTEKVSEW